MATGIPQSSSPNEVAPITAKRLTKVPLVRMGAFRQVSTKKDQKTKKEYTVEQVKLSLDWDSGYVLQNDEGEPILDDEGKTQPHYINDGFVTLSGHQKANLVPILRALGFDGPRFIIQDGAKKGGLTEEASNSIEVEFGTNGLGQSYKGCGWEELPFYVNRSEGGELDKRDVEVPVLSFKILGFEMLGRHLDMGLKIDNGWNRPDGYLASEDAVNLGEKPRTVRKSTPAKGMAPSDTTEDPLSPPFDTDEAPPAPAEDESDEGKARNYVRKQLLKAKVPIPFHAAVAKAVSGGDGFNTIDEMPLADARNFRDMVKAEPNVITEAHAFVQEGGSEADEEDDF